MLILQFCDKLSQNLGDPRHRPHSVMQLWPVAAYPRGSGRPNYCATTSLMFPRVITSSFSIKLRPPQRGSITSVPPRNWVGAGTSCLVHHPQKIPTPGFESSRREYVTVCTIHSMIWSPTGSVNNRLL